MKAQYNIDSGAIEIRLPDGTEMTMLINEIADGMNMTVRQEDEFTRLAYEHPLELADMLLTGQLEEYLKAFAKEQQSQEDIIGAQLQERGYSPTQAGMLARESLRYDS
jgi:hypothetical protein